MKPTENVSNLINCLTNDEDHRQQLWVHYLSGNPTSSLAHHLDKITREFDADCDMQVRLHLAFQDPPSDKFYKLLGCLSSIEQDIVSLLALGLSISEISDYKGISSIRIRQVISVIRDHDCWKELYGSEETTNT